MSKSLLSAIAKAVTKFKDKRNKDDQDALNYYDAVMIPDKKSIPMLPSEKTALMKNSIKEEFSAFFLDTSCTALTQIYKANSLWKRVVWTVLVIVMLVWMGIQCYWLLERYYNYPVEVKLDMKVSTVLDFPSVTICNLNPILEPNVHKDPYKPLIKYVKRLDDVDPLYKATKDNFNYNQDCSENDFRCSNGICMPMWWRCDGQKFCVNGDDEDNCEGYQCPDGQWKCTSPPKCIDNYYRCNGIPGDCSANTTEDEDDCENYQCPDGNWKCTSPPKCIYRGFRCDGRPGHCNENTTEDEDGCENYQCPDGYWKCTFPPKCISYWGRCNGLPGDCRENTTEDEDGCENYQCPDGNWKCASPPKCIYRDYRCDGRPGQCNENTTEDEDGCENYQCPDGQWKCTSPPKCIGYWGRCNGLPGDCRENTTEDEDGCENNTCPDAYFRCSTGRCIPSRWKCDGDHDCDNDELDCPVKVDPKAGNGKDVSTTTPSSHIDVEALFKNASFNKWKVLENGTLSLNFYADRDEEYEASMTYAYITAKLKASVVEQSGHDIMDMILACKFGGYHCSPMNFTYFHNHKYGNCYTFNSKFGNSSNLTTRFPGPENGLRLELFLDQRQYVANLAPDAGVRILVHKKGSMPFPEDDGISIMPGRSTSIGIRQVLLSRLKPPYGPCSDTARITDDYAAYYGTDYSKLACLKSCYQDLAIRHCDCAVPFYFVPDNSTICNMTDIENCVNGLPNTHTEGYEGCDTSCPIPCTETKYDLSISSAIWPSENYKWHLDERLRQTNSLYTRVNDSDKEFTKLQIYFQDLLYEHVQQERGYEVKLMFGCFAVVEMCLFNSYYLKSMNLISDFGGQLGLWLGLSAITIGEVCSFLFGVGRSLSFKCWCNKTKPIKNDLTPIMYIKPATLQEMVDEMCPEPAKYSPPEMNMSLPGSTEI